MRKTIDFWFDFASTYSYPAILRVNNMATASGISVHWRPFLLGAVFKEQGLNDSPFNVYPEKGRYMWRDMERICEAESLPFKRPSMFPRNGLLASRVACLFESAPWIFDFIQQVFIANFYGDSDISDTKVISRIVASLNLDSQDILSQSNTEEAKQKLRIQTELAHSTGIFGAPTLMIGNEMFWGHDRVEQAIGFALGTYP